MYVIFHMIPMHMKPLCKSIDIEDECHVDCSFSWIIENKGRKMAFALDKRDYIFVYFKNHSLYSNLLVCVCMCEVGKIMWFLENKCARYIFGVSRWLFKGTVVSYSMHLSVLCIYFVNAVCFCFVHYVCMNVHMMWFSEMFSKGYNVKSELFCNAVLGAVWHVLWCCDVKACSTNIKL